MFLASKFTSLLQTNKTKLPVFFQKKFKNSARAKD